MTTYTNAELVQRLSAIREKLSDGIRRFVIRTDTLGRESHGIVCEVANQLGDLVDELSRDDRESWEDVEKRIAKEADRRRRDNPVLSGRARLR